MSASFNFAGLAGWFKSRAGIWAFGFVIFLSLFLVACSGSGENQGAEVTFSTDLGEIVILLDEVNAPETSAFFLQQVRRGTYDEASIFRAGSRGDIGKAPKFLEGGPLSKIVNDRRVTSLDPSILAMLEVLETTKITGLKHERGSVSFARNVLGEGQVIPDIVFCLTELPEFDFEGIQSPDGRGFPVFGRVIRGLDVLDEIAEMERNGETHIPLVEGQILTNPVMLGKVSIRNKLTKNSTTQ